MSTTSPIANPAQPADNSADRSKAKLQAAARDFEALFMSYMLKSMRESASTDETFGESFGGDMFDGLFDMEISRQMSRNSSMGIAEMLYHKMTGESLPSAGHAAPAGKSPAPEVKPLLPLPLHPQPSKAATAPPSTEAGPPAAEQPGKTQPPSKGSPAVSTQPVKPAAGSRRGKDTVSQRLDRYDDAIREAAEKHNLDPNLLRAVIASESGGNAKARSSKNAKGLMQLIDSTAADMGVKNIWDPRENILAGAKYLQQLLNRFGGNVDTALASYNAGPGAVEKHGGIPPFKETQDYVQRVKSFVQHFKQLEGDANDDE